MKPSMWTLVVLILTMIFWLTFCSGCTIKVEPIAKPKPVIVKVVRHGQHHRSHPHKTPSPHGGMLTPEEPTRLIEHPTPSPP